MNLKSPINTFCLFVSIWLSHGPVTAADIRPFISGSYRAVVIEGAIERGDADAFVHIIRENEGKISTVYTFSPGGDFLESMKIGRAMRELELASQVPMRSQSGQPDCEDVPFVSVPKPTDPRNCTCASACFFVHIGAVSRGGTYLAVHRPTFVEGDYGKLPQADAEKAFTQLQDSARDYMGDMGVPKHIQEEVLGTPSERALVLDDKTVKTYFWLGLPYRHEWIRNACPGLSVAEEERYRNFGPRLRTANPSHDDLSRAEWDDLAALNKKQAEAGQCAVLIGQQSRDEAYERYFGVKPNDWGRHTYSKWSGSAKYLGRRFYELLAEERFSEDNTSLGTYLNRPASAIAPSVQLSDSPDKPKVVSRVSVFSTPNPSAEFTQRLVNSLEDAWGKRTGGNGTAEWRWQGSGLSAKLSYEPKSAEGPYLHLVITQK